MGCKKKCYSLESGDINEVVLTMYGDIVETVPYDPWEEKTATGNFITKDEFLLDIEDLNCKKLTIHMDSLGGDAAASLFIHNKLRELSARGVELECIVDGVAMSGGSLIMCACDKVTVNPSSLIMIHKCWSTLFGGYNADDLRKMAEVNDAYDKAQASVYARKTGKSDSSILKLMSKTTYLTGSEAVAEGFADCLLDAPPLSICASADGSSLIVKGRKIRLMPGTFAPDFIPTIKDNIPTNEESKKMNIKDDEAKTAKTKVLDECNAESEKAKIDVLVSAAVMSERKRLQEIDEIATIFNPEIVANAKYNNPCTAHEMAYRAAKAEVKAGAGFINGINKDFINSGVLDVPVANAKPDLAEEDTTPEGRMKSARELIKSVLGGEIK